MAYHYLLHRDGGVKTIRTESLPDYAGKPAIWQIFDTEAERDAAATRKVWAWHPIQQPSGLQIYVREVHGYRAYKYEIFDTHEAMDAFVATAQVTYWYEPQGGDAIRMVRAWKPEDMARVRGWVGPFPTELEAAKARERLYVWAWDMSEPRFDWRRIMPYQTAEYRGAGWLVGEIGETKEQVEAKRPIRFVQQANGTYKRINFGGSLQRASMYRNLRGLLRMSLDERYFSVPGGNRTEDSHQFLARLGERIRLKRNARPSLFDRLEKLAPGHFAQCSCGAPFVERESARDLQGNHYCTSCASIYRHQFVGTCEQCGVLLRESEAREGEETYVCPAHPVHVRVLPANGDLARYSANVLRHVEGFKLGKLEAKPSIWLGFELETYTRPSAGERETIIQNVQQWPHCICKSDGSIGMGFEIVSIPASLRWHQENTAPWLATVNQQLEAWDHKDCGMHVHVGKRELSDLTMAKLVTFMHEQENQAFLDNVAGRRSNGYAERGGHSVIALRRFKREGELGRYRAINFATKGNKTIEFRIFQANVAIVGFMKNLEFVHALVSWCNVTSLQQIARTDFGIKSKRGNEPAHAGFIAFVVANSRLYPNLMQWLERQQYVKARALDVGKLSPEHLVRLLAKHGDMQDVATLPVPAIEEDDDEEFFEEEYEPEEANG